MPADGFVVEPRPNRLSANSSLRSDVGLDTNLCHRSVATSLVTAIVHVPMRTNLGGLLTTASSRTRLKSQGMKET